ncbi:MAG: ATP cone domain-containing protein [Thermoproteus sp.]|jgi:transcriptional regulator NrdR family protein|uniref:ATP cone domain-containing protein n=1 Tax=Thermoproteus sp. CP80 TaxID=1650659 RepID=UPI0009C13AED|nr:ATP cone domain-containing protein [Thermoproteus sp. CP80]PLC67234.1 ATPase [Thermoproteus sp. CP80]
MVKVVKRDGREEEFIPEKIVVSVLKAGAPLDVARRIARKVECAVSDSETVTARDIAKVILAELKKANEEWYRNWVIFDKAVKRRHTDKELQI